MARGAPVAADYTSIPSPHAPDRRSTGVERARQESTALEERLYGDRGDALLRRPAVQSPFEAVCQVDQGQADCQVDERRRDQGRPVECLGLQYARRAQELGEPYDRDEGGVLHQGD